MSDSWNYLHGHMESVFDTRMQRKVRRMAPWPVGAVFIQTPDMTDDDMRAMFRQMRECGFTNFKQIMKCPGTSSAHIFRLALEEGIIPWWYGEAGWEEITPDLLERLGLPPDMDVDEAMAHPKVIEHQKAFLRARIEREAAAEAEREDRDARRQRTREDAARVPGVVGDAQGWRLHDGAEPFFVDWLKAEYGDVETLKEAWNVHHAGITEAAPRWRTWDDVLAGLHTDIPDREYRHLRDIMRFRAETYVRQHILPRVRKRDETDPEMPMRAGGEMGLFLPFASRGTDMQAIAHAMAEGGSFYPSIHPAWHFEEVGFELVRPMYMQAQTTTGWAKGIWNATWESTGGPQYFSGGKAPFTPEARDKIAGYTIDAGAMTQIMLSWLAAGYRGNGIWTWNGRTAGWEAGEFCLTDRNSKPGERAKAVGAIGQAARRLRRELWQATKEPWVGILADWENEAFWAAMSVTGRDRFRSEPIRARIGACRAFINANVPWEFVTPFDLEQGLGPRYRVIYLPAQIALTDSLQMMLEAYVRQGGRLVMDMPSAYYDGHGRLLPTGEGSWLERVFGAELNEYGFVNNVPHAVAGVDLEGFVARITPTDASVAETFADGLPAITEHRLGDGTAVLVGAQLALMAKAPGRTSVEALLVRTALGPYEPPVTCDGAIVYRLAAPAADHYVLINDGPARDADLITPLWSYSGAEDAVSGEKIALPGPIPLPAHGGRWVRAVKA